MSQMSFLHVIQKHLLRTLKNKLLLLNIYKNHRRDKIELLVSMENMSVISVTKHILVQVACVCTNNQSIRVSSMFVISVTTKLDTKVT